MLALLSILLIVSIQHLDAAKLRDRISTTSAVSIPKPTQSFVPLTCNANIDNVKCSSWSDYFRTLSGSGSTMTTTKTMIYTERVIVPCGECIMIDPFAMNGCNMIFEDGIDIQGKLVLLDGTQLNITTPMIIVQGTFQMYATKQSVTGTPPIHITLTGQDEQQGFVPMDSNRNKCNGNNIKKKKDDDINDNAICKIGKKSITVAGGQVDIQGLPPNTPTWVKLYDVAYMANDVKGYPSAIVIEDSVYNKWDVGAEILISSHTREWNQHQQRTIRSISKYDYQNGYIVLELDTPILQPTTIRQSPEYAVEVALLSRNIVFRGGDDDMEYHGGHFLIMGTPFVQQTLIGVDIQNFGQQGNIGRYPIHLHWNGNMTGSIIAKNTIRQSNQRCIVLHGTSNLLVESNVAYDTKGHCFMIEDGIETENMFVRNLGAQTGVPKKLIPNLGPNGVETDDNPSTFWITNPANSWIGNVAAGSESSGYWFELMIRGTDADLYPNLDPKRASLITFQDNVAHSNMNKGFQTYPTGYMPDGLQEMIGLKSYRNGGQGIFLHVTTNIKIVGALVADNRFIGIDIDRAEGIVVTNTTVIGQSRSYTELMSAQDDIGSLCSMDRLFGIDLHTWKLVPDNDKVTIEDVTFVGYDNNTCIKSYPLHMDNDSRTGQFNAYSTFNRLTISNQASAITFCDAEGNGIDDIYITDLDGSLFIPAADEHVIVPSSLVSNSQSMMTFLGQKKCTQNPKDCFNYCEGTCFRSFRYEIDPVNTEGYSLKVCSRDDPSLCISSNGYQKYKDLKDYNVGENRIFFIHVPVGFYTAQFVNEKNMPVWPSFVYSYEDESTTCPIPFPDDHPIQLIPPPLAPNECRQLIRNGNFEASNMDPKYWLFRNADGIEVVSKMGVGSSNALSPMNRDGRASLIQYLDTRCLSQQRGSIYQLSVMVQLVSPSGQPFICDSNKRECPEIGYRSSYDNTYHRLAMMEATTTVSGPRLLQLITSYLEIDDDIASSGQTLIYIQSNVDNMRLIVDDVTLTLFDRNKVQDMCSNLVTVPDNQLTKYWNVIDHGALDDSSSSGRNNVATIRGARDPDSSSVLLFHQRRQDSDAIVYQYWPTLMVSKCILPETKWKLILPFQLLQNGTPISCHGTSDNIDENASDNDCPIVRFYILDGKKDVYVITEKYRSHPTTTKQNDYNTIVEVTIALPSIQSDTTSTSNNKKSNDSGMQLWDGTIGKIGLQIGNFPSTYDIQINMSMLQMNPI